MTGFKQHSDEDNKNTPRDAVEPFADSTLDAVDIEPLNDPDLEQLTAYLDGELEPEAIQQVETRLADDVEYRSRLQELQRAWDLLEQLPLTEPNQAFTKSTLALVVEDLTKQTKRQRRNLLTWPIRIAVLVALPVVAFLTSNWVTGYIQNAENRQLVEDLPLIENLDVYRKAESIDFLTALEKSGLFDDETPIEELLDD